MGLKQAVRPAYTCRPGEILVAAGVCRRSSQGANCGPSYRFNAANGQCRQVLGDP